MDSDAGESTADEMTKSTKRGSKRAVSKNMEKVPEVPEVPEPETTGSKPSAPLTTETATESPKKEKTPNKSQPEPEKKGEKLAEVEHEQKETKEHENKNEEEEKKEEEDDGKEERSSLRRSFSSFFTRPKKDQAEGTTGETEEKPSQGTDEKASKKPILPFFGEDMPFPLSQIAGPSPQDTAQLIKDASAMVADAKESPRETPVSKSSKQSLSPLNKRKADVQQAEDARLDAIAARDDVSIPHPGPVAAERPAKKSKMLSERLRRERVRNRSFYGFTAALGLL